MTLQHRHSRQGWHIGDQPPPSTEVHQGSSERAIPGLRPQDSGFAPEGHQCIWPHQHGRESIPLQTASITPAHPHTSPGWGDLIVPSKTKTAAGRRETIALSNYNQSSMTSPLQTDAGGTSPPTPTWVSSSVASYSRIDIFLLSPGLRICSLTS